MEDFITWSGWAFGLISTVVAIMQYRQKEVLKNKITNIRNENYSADNGGVAVRDNRGGIHIEKK